MANEDVSYSLPVTPFLKVKRKTVTTNSLPPSPYEFMRDIRHASSKITHGCSPSVATRPKSPPHIERLMLPPPHTVPRRQPKSRTFRPALTTTVKSLALDAESLPLLKDHGQGEEATRMSPSDTLGVRLNELLRGQDTETVTESESDVQCTIKNRPSVSDVLIPYLQAADIQNTPSVQQAEPIEPGCKSQSQLQSDADAKQKRIDKIFVNLKIAEKVHVYLYLTYPKRVVGVISCIPTYFS